LHMKRLALPAGFILLLLALVSCDPRAQSNSAPPKDVAVAAQGFVEMLVKNDFAAAEQNFDADMKAGLPQDKLAEVWQALIGQVGPFKKQISTQKGKAEGYDVVVVKCQFENGVIGIRTAYNKSGQISGLFFDPVK
ncbi:MAG TPA: DUF3887 domain-containing protein, partial [Pyrinomonadaceae bacterium]|nr:DUF3887 domain-containing protein [Pyrinomonadaceae bacterium]